MNDERIFERLAAHAGPTDVDPGFDDQLYALLQQEMRRSGRSSRPALLLVAALLLALAVSGAALVLSGIVDRPVLPDSSAPRLAYSLVGDIYVADADGANPVRIADGAPPDDDAECGNLGVEGSMWSPDGKYLAYRSDGWHGDVDDPCPAIVQVHDAAGHLVASLPGEGWLVGWSPDSTRIATWVDVYDQPIIVYGLDGVRQALLSAPSACQGSGDNDVRWSLDGRSLVAGDCEVPIDGGTPRRLPASDPRGLWVSSYSSDGTRVAYTTFTEDRSERSMTNSLVIADADGTELRVVPYPDSLEDGTVDNVFLHNLIWSPSGDRVAFTWTPLDVNGSSVERAAELRVLDVASGIVRTAAAKRSIRPIRFSPDGDRILFATDGGVDGTGLWSVDADGSDVQLVVPGAGWGDWQPRPPGS